MLAQSRAAVSPTIAKIRYNSRISDSRSSAFTSRCHRSVIARAFNLVVRASRSLDRSGGAVPRTVDPVTVDAARPGGRVCPDRSSPAALDAVRARDWLSRCGDGLAAGGVVV